MSNETEERLFTRQAIEEYGQLVIKHVILALQDKHHRDLRSLEEDNERLKHQLSRASATEIGGNEQSVLPPGTSALEKPSEEVRSLRDRIESLQERLATAKTNADDERDSKEQQISGLQADHVAQVAHLKEKITALHENATCTLHGHDTEVMKMRARYEKKTEDMRATHKNEMEELRVTHKNEMEELRVTHKDEVEKLRATYKNETSALGEYTEQIDHRVRQAKTERLTDDRGSVHVWLRIRPPAAGVKPLTGLLVQRDSVRLLDSVDPWSLHHVFGDDGDNGHIDHAAATNPNVAEEWLRFVKDPTHEGLPMLLLAYGQTGSGKTETLLGRPDKKDNQTNKFKKQPASRTLKVNFNDLAGNEHRLGLVPRTIRTLRENGCTVEALVLQIYNKKTTNLTGHPDGTRRGDVVNFSSTMEAGDLSTKRLRYEDFQPVSSFPIASDDALDEWLRIISSCRQQKDTTVLAKGTSTGSNQTSSRSHLLIIVNAMSHASGFCQEMWFVDLAGNEDYKAIDQELSQETKDINAALGELVALVKDVAKIAKEAPSEKVKVEKWLEKALLVRRNKHVSILPHRICTVGKLPC